MNRTCAVALASTLVCLAALPASAPAATTQTLYGADGSGGNPSNLYEIDRDTGAVVRTIGPIGFAVTGLAIHPETAELYGSTGGNAPNDPGSTIKINKATGDGTLIGDQIPATDSGAADITFTSDGTLYGWSEGSDDLVTINLASGAATVVGESGAGTLGSGLSASPDDTLFFAGQLDVGNLMTVSRTTGLLTTVALMDGTVGDAINALAFDDRETLLGSRRLDNQLDRDLITINTSNGHITSIGPSVARLDAIEFSEAHPRCKGASANVLGTSREDSLRGTKGRALVAGGRGNDRLRGRGGEDCVFGESGNDNAGGGRGKDKIVAGGGNDTMKARDGKKDKLNCGGGNDTAKVDAKDKVKKCEDVRVR
jgi:RTX calcium-binding nonapeptide repeat (4 copies)